MRRWSGKGRHSAGRERQGVQAPTPPPKSPGAAGRELRTGGKAAKELLTLLSLWLGVGAVTLGEKLHVGAFGKDRCPDVRPGQMVLLV